MEWEEDGDIVNPVKPPRAKAKVKAQGKDLDSGKAALDRYEGKNLENVCNSASDGSMMQITPLAVWAAGTSGGALLGRAEALGKLFARSCPCVW